MIKIVNKHSLFFLDNFCRSLGGVKLSSEEQN
jgi:hypothetical protein